MNCLKKTLLSFRSALCSLKRDTTKLTPADMLALVALVEAGERARKESDVDSGISVPLADAEEMDYVPQGTWLDAPVALPATSSGQQQQQSQPALIDYYGIPVEAQVVPKYEYLQRPQKYIANNNREYPNLYIIGILYIKGLLISFITGFGSLKRFMVSKKKRSVSQNQFFNEPVGERGPSYFGEKFF